MRRLLTCVCVLGLSMGFGCGDDSGGSGVGSDMGGEFGLADEAFMEMGGGDFGEERGGEADGDFGADMDGGFDSFAVWLAAAVGVWLVWTAGRRRLRICEL